MYVFDPILFFGSVIYAQRYMMQATLWSVWNIKECVHYIKALLGSTSGSNLYFCQPASYAIHISSLNLTHYTHELTLYKKSYPYALYTLLYTNHAPFWKPCIVILLTNYYFTFQFCFEPSPILFGLKDTHNKGLSSTAWQQTAHWLILDAFQNS